MKKNGTVKMLVLSAVSVVLCLVMLLGATFAWFSTKVESTTNIIRTGSFEVDIEYWAPDKAENATAIEAHSFPSDAFTTLADAFKLFDNTLAPGEDTGIKYIKVTNRNSYAVKVDLDITIGNVVGTDEIADDDYELLFCKAETTVPVSYATLAGGSGNVYLDSYDKDNIFSVLDSVVLQPNGNNGDTIIVALASGLPENAERTNVQIDFIITVNVEQISGT